MNFLRKLAGYHDDPQRPFVEQLRLVAAEEPTDDAVKHCLLLTKQVIKVLFHTNIME